MGKPLSLYIHWPFCLSKCPYCDFNSLAVDQVDQGRWVGALLREMEHFAEPTIKRPLLSIFFGGGTPSLLRPDMVNRLIEGARGFWPFLPNVEISLEANPGSVEASCFQGYAAAGINRLSLGLQSLNDKYLAFLGRRHTAREGRLAAEVAAKAFPRTSIDLIYGLPGQAVNDWINELNQAAKLPQGHLSAYLLTIEPGTPFHTDGVAEAEEDQAADLYLATQNVLTAAGMPAYEVSNHAVRGQECRHNLAGWRGVDYVGIGPGAHGRVDDTATHQIRDPFRWLASAETIGHGTAGRKHLSLAERWEEKVLTGLRTAEGIGPILISPLCQDKIKDLIEIGMLERYGDRLRTTIEGRLCLNAVTSELLADQ